MNKEEVIKITLGLLKERKLEKASIGEIVKRLESSPGNLYYHFKNKNDIYKEASEYSVGEIIKKLDRVKTGKDSQDYLFELTRSLIRFFEEREEILFFLISMKGSCYLEKELNSDSFLLNFKKVLLMKKHDTKHENRINLKLNMFLGSLYEVLYVNRLVNNRNLSEEEIEDVYMSFWGKNITENYKKYEQDNRKKEVL